MRHIKEILSIVLDAIVKRYLQWQIDRDTEKLTKKKQHWQAGSLGGASIQLGHMTRDDAIDKVAKLRDGPVVFIDDERGFIAFGNPPANTQA
jgi:hypothetical protein